MQSRGLEINFQYTISLYGPLKSVGWPTVHFLNTYKWTMTNTSTSTSYYDKFQFYSHTKSGLVKYLKLKISIIENPNI